MGCGMDFSTDIQEVSRYVTTFFRSLLVDETMSTYPLKHIIFLETRIYPNIQEFMVKIPKSIDPFSEILDRIKSYMELQGLSNLQCESVDAQSISYLSHRSHAVDCSIETLIDQPEWILDFSLRFSETEKSSAVFSIIVHLCCYSNSSIGDEVVNRITSKMRGEICRTNRQWRRRINQKGCFIQEIC